MKRLSFISLTLVLMLNAQAQYQQLSYSFAYDTAKMVLNVNMQLNGTDSGKTYLQLPDRWASETEFYKTIQSLTIKTKGASLHTTDDSTVRYIIHKPNQKLEIEYALKQDWSGEINSPKDFRAILQKQYLQLSGFALFILPQAVWEDNFDIKLDWSKLPKSWTVANSLHAQTRKYKGQLTMQNLRNSFYVAGDFRLYQSMIANQSIFIALRGNNWKFQDSAFVNKVNTLISMQRKFWNDYSEPYYLVSLIPFDGRGSQHGSALHQSFMLGMSQDLTLDASAIPLLTHEYFHRWNGVTIQLKGVERENTWFSEGFTEYYAYKLLHKSGLITLPEFVEGTNRTIAEYYLSPVRNESQESIGKNFWSTRDFQQIAYKKGFVYALSLDHSIQTASSQKYSLDNVMFDLHKAAKEKQSLTDTLFIQLVKKYAGKDIHNSHKEYITEGKTIPVDFGSLGVNTVGYIKNRSAFDIGFDLSASWKAKEIVGLKEGSEAWKAGLRNGQKLKGYSFQNNNIAVPVEIEIKEGEMVKKISYLPISIDKYDIPQFSLKQQ